MKSAAAPNARPLFDPFARRVLIWMCILVTIQQFSFAAVLPVVSLYAESFGVSIAAIGLAFAVPQVVRVFTNIPTGALADRSGRKSVLTLSGILLTIGCVGCAVAPTYATFLAARGVVGGGIALIVTGGQIVMTDVSEPHNRGRLLGIYNGVAMVTVFLGALPGGWLATHYGIKAPFGAAAVMAVGMTLVAWMFVPETRGLAETSSSHAATVEKPAILTQLSIFARSKPLLLLATAAFALSMGRLGGWQALVPLLGDKDLGLNPTQVGLGFGFMSAASILFVWPGSVLTDSWGRKPVIMISGLLLAASFVLFAISSGFSTFLLSWFVAAIASGFAAGSAIAYIADIAPPGMNAIAVALYFSIMDIGGVVGPVALGFVADLWTVRMAITVLAAAIALAYIVFGVLAPETHPDKQARSFLI